MSEPKPGRLLSYKVFPPGLEVTLPPLHQDMIRTWRKELENELDQGLSVTFDKSDNQRRIAIEKPYYEKIWSIMTEEEYRRLGCETPIVKAFREMWKKTYGEPALKQHACETCQNVGPWKKCGRCKTTPYCSLECQRKDWEKHKISCYPPKRM
jgi:hypothetical protein